MIMKWSKRSGIKKLLDETKQYSQGRQIFNIIISTRLSPTNSSVPSFGAVVSYNSCDPIYLIKVNENEVMRDHYGYSISPGELFLRGNYLKSEQSRNMSLKKFSIVSGEVLCDPVEFLKVCLTS